MRHAVVSGAASESLYRWPASIDCNNLSLTAGLAFAPRSSSGFVATASPNARASHALSSLPAWTSAWPHRGKTCRGLLVLHPGHLHVRTEKTLGQAGRSVLSGLRPM